MSIGRKWKVIVPTVVLAVLIGGVAWAATNGPASPKTGTAAIDRPFLGGQGLSAGTQAGRWASFRSRASHITEAKVGFFYDGQTHTLTIEHGLITETAPDAITLKRLDGQTVSVPVSDQTKVRLDRQWSSLDALKAGDRIFTFQIDGAAARLVVAFDRFEAPAGAAGDAGDVGSAGDQMIAAALGLAG